MAEYPEQTIREYTHLNEDGYTSLLKRSCPVFTQWGVTPLRTAACSNSQNGRSADPLSHYGCLARVRWLRFSSEYRIAGWLGWAREVHSNQNACRGKRHTSSINPGMSSLRKAKSAFCHRQVLAESIHAPDLDCREEEMLHFRHPHSWKVFDWAARGHRLEYDLSTE